MDSVYKAKNLCLIRDHLIKPKPELEARLLEKLSPEVTTAYNNALAFSWIAESQWLEILEIAAELLYPGQEDRFSELGRISASADAKGAYKFLVRFTTIPFMLSLVAKVYGFQNKEGSASVDIQAEQKRAVISIYGRPNVQPSHLLFIQGYILGGLEVAGRTGIHITHDFSNVEEWQYIVTW